MWEVGACAAHLDCVVRRLACRRGRAAASTRAPPLLRRLDAPLTLGFRGGAVKWRGGGSRGRALAALRLAAALELFDAAHGGSCVGFLFRLSIILLLRLSGHGNGVANGELVPRRRARAATAQALPARQQSVCSASNEGDQGEHNVDVDIAAKTDNGVGGPGQCLELEAQATVRGALHSTCCSTPAGPRHSCDTTSPLQRPSASLNPRLVGRLEVSTGPCWGAFGLAISCTRSACSGRQCAIMSGIVGLQCCSADYHHSQPTSACSLQRPSHWPRGLCARCEAGTWPLPVVSVALAGFVVSLSQIGGAAGAVGPAVASEGPSAATGSACC